jgi:hypothetical protein
MIWTKIDFPLQDLTSNPIKSVTEIHSLVSEMKYEDKRMDIHDRPSHNHFMHSVETTSRSRWPRGLRHELSSLGRTLGSWFRIPLKALMSILCAFILYSWCSVCRGGFGMGWSPVKVVLPTLHRTKKIKKWLRPKKGLQKHKNNLLKRSLQLYRYNSLLSNVIILFEPTCRFYVIKTHERATQYTSISRSTLLHGAGILPEMFRSGEEIPLFYMKPKISLTSSKDPTVWLSSGRGL